MVIFRVTCEEDSLLHCRMPMLEEKGDMEIIVKLPVYMTGKKIMPFISRGSKREMW